MRLAFFLLAAGSLVGACGDDDDGDAILAQLQAIPGLTAERLETDQAGAAFFHLVFEVPIDHTNPGSATFPLHANLVHRAASAPLVANTTGYYEYFGDNSAEPTSILGANQVSIEHRYFGDSTPDLAGDPSLWQFLTIKQMADDQHQVLAALATIYPGPVISTGGSKGGMTAVYHHRFYPDDVAGTIAYVAPLSFGVPDERYATFLDEVGTPACRDALRATTVDMLQNRRAMLEAKAQAEADAKGFTYTRIALPAAVESAVTAVEFSFWQKFGAAACDSIPTPASSDDDVWRFLQGVAAVSESDDEDLALFEPYVYQAYAQLGFPSLGGEELEPLLMFTDEDYSGALSVPLPAYDGGAAMRDIDAFVQTAPDIVFIYGEVDPWSAGAFTTPNKFIVSGGTHNSATLLALGDGDRATIATKLGEWLGTTVTLRTAPAAVSQRMARGVSSRHE